MYFIGTLTAEQEVKIDQLMALASTRCDPLSVLFSRWPQMAFADQPTPFNNLRLDAHSYLVARRWNVEDALSMLIKSHEFRVQHNFQSYRVLPTSMAIHGYDLCEMQKLFELEPRPPSRLEQILSLVNTCVPSSLHYWDKTGLPVLWIAIGSTDVRGLVRGLEKLCEGPEKGADVFADYVRHVMGLGEVIMLYQQQRIRNGELCREGIDNSKGLVRTITIVADARDLSMKMLWKPAIDLFMTSMRIITANFPNCVSKILVVNAPRIATIVYKVIRHVLPTDMQSKITFHNASHSPAELKNVIAAEHIPVAYGGTCQCADGCIGIHKSHRANSLNNGNAVDATTDSNPQLPTVEEQLCSPDANIVVTQKGRDEMLQRFAM